MFKQLSNGFFWAPDDIYEAENGKGTFIPLFHSMFIAYQCIFHHISLLVNDVQSLDKLHVKAICDFSLEDSRSSPCTLYSNNLC